MSLRQFQKQVDDWISQYEEGYWPPYAILTRIQEEVGELATEVERLNYDFGDYLKQLLLSKFFKTVIGVGKRARGFLIFLGIKNRKEIEYEKSSIEEECADILFAVICLANSRGIDLGIELQKVIQEKCYGRDKDRFEKKKRR
ncbi:MAG: hypothetical protein K9M15_03100 [Candidatus Marinimicrobia bacterium]|nr:hypothetical protein [Candidatus Neomarinimicrobiota bacterium]